MREVHGFCYSECWWVPLLIAQYGRTAALQGTTDVYVNNGVHISTR